jgi:hypothetical protein
MVQQERSCVGNDDQEHNKGCKHIGPTFAWGNIFKKKNCDKDNFKILKYILYAKKKLKMKFSTTLLSNLFIYYGVLISS